MVQSFWSVRSLQALFVLPLLEHGGAGTRSERLTDAAQWACVTGKYLVTVQGQSCYPRLCCCLLLTAEWQLMSSSLSLFSLSVSLMPSPSHRINLNTADSYFTKMYLTVSVESSSLWSLVFSTRLVSTGRVWTHTQGFFLVRLFSCWKK